MPQIISFLSMCNYNCRLFLFSPRNIFGHCNKKIVNLNSRRTMFLFNTPFVERNASQNFFFYIQLCTTCLAYRVYHILHKSINNGASKTEKSEAKLTVVPIIFDALGTYRVFVRLLDIRWKTMTSGELSDVKIIIVTWVSSVVELVSYFHCYD